MASQDPEVLRCCLDTIQSLYRGEVPAEGVLITCDHCFGYLQYAEHHWHWMQSDWQTLRRLAYRVSEARRSAIVKLLETHGELYETEKARVLGTP